MLARLLCLCVLAGAVAATAAAAASGTARATVTFHRKTVTFSGGRCRKAVRGLQVTIGRLGGPKYFQLLYILTRRSGTYRNGGIVTVVVKGKDYISQHGRLTLTIGNHARKGTFSGRFTSGRSFKGSFSC